MPRPLGGVVYYANAARKYDAVHVILKGAGLPVENLLR